MIAPSLIGTLRQPSLCHHLSGNKHRASAAKTLDHGAVTAGFAAPFFGANISQAGHSSKCHSAQGCYVTVMNESSASSPPPAYWRYATNPQRHARTGADPNNMNGIYNADMADATRGSRSRHDGIR
jgi:hypothetical protein